MSPERDRGRLRRLAPALLVACVGCHAADTTKTARVVGVDQKGLEVAMPANTAYYRKKAKQLMAERFPNGYTIVQEKETETSDSDTVVRKSMLRRGRDDTKLTHRREYRITARGNDTSIR